MQASILLSSVSISFCFLRDFEPKAFDFTNKSILLFIFFSASMARASASLVSYWTHVCVQASSVKLIGFLLCSVHLVWKCIEKSCRKPISYKPEDGIPWLFTDFSIIKDFLWLFKRFPDFSLTLKKFSFLPDFYLTVATLWKETQDQQKLNAIVIAIIHKCFFFIYEHLTHH